METDYKGRIHCFVEVAIDGLFHHRSQFFNTVPLGVDSITQRRGIVATIDFVLPHLKDDFSHAWNVIGALLVGKSCRKRQTHVPQNVR